MIGCRLLSLSFLSGLSVLGGLVLDGGLGSVAQAEPASDSLVKEAGKHFQRGVTLYNEADYRAALVEFKRAYEIAPNSAVLYNIGQTYYQLQNYASALSTLGRYLTESGPGAPHRKDVEQTIDTLQTRVGKVAVTTNVADCDISIDDELVGKTPITDPVLVSIGHRKVTATHEGRPPQTRFVDVAAGDTVKLSISLGDAGGAETLLPKTNGTPSGNGGSGLITAGWITTGVLGAGALTSGVLAYLASRDLQSARDTFPVSHDELVKKSSRVTTFSIVGDILGIATVVVGGVTLTYSLSRSPSHEVHVAVVPNGIQFAGTFK
jgi:hypothetical protein